MHRLNLQQVSCPTASFSSVGIKANDPSNCLFWAHAARAAICHLFQCKRGEWRGLSDGPNLGNKLAYPV